MLCLRVKIYRKRVIRLYLCFRKSTLVVVARRVWRGKDILGFLSYTLVFSGMLWNFGERVN